MIASKKLPCGPLRNDVVFYLSQHRDLETYYAGKGLKYLIARQKSINFSWWATCNTMQTNRCQELRLLRNSIFVHCHCYEMHTARIRDFGIGSCPLFNKWTDNSLSKTHCCKWDMSHIFHIMLKPIYRYGSIIWDWLKLIPKWPQDQVAVYMGYRCCFCKQKRKATRVLWK